MNWRNMFFTGLILGLSPFTLPVDHYLFAYSLLGFGMCAVSFVLKSGLNAWDYALIGDLTLIVTAGLFNLFTILIFFEYLMFAILFAYISLAGRDSPARLISLPMLAVSGILMALLAGIAAGMSTFLDAVIPIRVFGIRTLSDVIIFLLYFIYFMGGAAFLLGCRELDATGDYAAETAVQEIELPGNILAGSPASGFGGWLKCIYYGYFAGTAAFSILTIILLIFLVLSPAISGHRFFFIISILFSVIQAYYFYRVISILRESEKSVPGVLISTYIGLIIASAVLLLINIVYQIFLKGDYKLFILFGRACLISIMLCISVILYFKNSKRVKDYYKD